MLIVSFLAIAHALPVDGDWTSLILNYSNARYVNSTINASTVTQLVPVWNDITVNQTSSTPIVSNGIVYFSDWGGITYAANITTGHIIWRMNLGGGISGTSEVYNGTDYVAFGPNGTADVGSLGRNIVVGHTLSIIALNATTG